MNITVALSHGAGRDGGGLAFTRENHPGEKTLLEPSPGSSPVLPVRTTAPQFSSVLPSAPQYGSQRSQYSAMVPVQLSSALSTAPRAPIKASSAPSTPQHTSILPVQLSELPVLPSTAPRAPRTAPSTPSITPRAPSTAQHSQYCSVF